MTQEHPITPPPELTQEWSCDCPLTDPFSREFYVATQAARWGADQQLQLDIEQVNRAWQKGADQELEACVEWFKNRGYHSDVYQDLLTARRPKPPSLKEQALKALKNIDDACESEGFSRSDDTDIIRRALESLPE